VSRDGVLGGGGGVGPAAGGAPYENARFRLIEAPALSLLDPVMVPAQRSHPAFAGEAAQVPGDRMVQVAAGRRAAASGRGAAGVPGADQVLEFAAGLVPGLGMAVIAGAPGDHGQLDLQATQVVLRPRRDVWWLRSRWFGPWWFGSRWIDA
jgi:hypothetical protein